jgi:adenine-specific DNA-methyltransferase
MKVQTHSLATPAVRSLEDGGRTVLFIGDCMDIIRHLPDNSIDLTITSPPYCIGKEYETSKSADDFVADHEIVLPEIVRITREGGSICWQVGYHVTDQTAAPLDYWVYSIMAKIKGVTLRNRIVWSFGHGLHSTARLSGRHEMILWFTKGQNYHFDLDSIRVAQKYPGKRHYKGPKKGELSGNPNGKNPGDVWEIPNVKGNHIEKTDHPCQFPVGLAERCVRAFCPADGIVFDPYMGSASSGVAAILNGRRFLGAEKNEKYEALARTRLMQAHAGTVPFRPSEQPIYVPTSRDAVARRPEHFREVFQ